MGLDESRRFCVSVDGMAGAHAMGCRSRGALQLLGPQDLWSAGRAGGLSVSATLEGRLAQSEGAVCRLGALRERRMRRVREAPSHVHRPCRARFAAPGLIEPAHEDAESASRR